MGRKEYVIFKEPPKAYICVARRLGQCEGSVKCHHQELHQPHSACKEGMCCTPPFSGIITACAMEVPKNREAELEAIICKKDKEIVFFINMALHFAMKGGENNDK